MAQRQIIVRRARPKETRIQNGIIWNDRLSPMARFSLIAMLSLPDFWDYSVRGMAAILHISKDTMSKYIRELESAGYVKRRQAHSRAGTFAGVTYIMTDTPWDFGPEAGEGPRPNFPEPVEPEPEKPPQKKRTEQWTDEGKNNPPCSPPEGEGAGLDGLKPRPKRTRRQKSVPDHSPERFEQFWAAYPGGGSRLKAASAWDALKPGDALIDEMARALKRQMASRQWREGVGIPHASTWLNQRRWTDKLPETPRTAEPGGWADDPEVMPDG